MLHARWYAMLWWQWNRHREGCSYTWRGRQEAPREVFRRRVGQPFLEAFAAIGWFSEWERVPLFPLITTSLRHGDCQEMFSLVLKNARRRAAAALPPPSDRCSPRIDAAAVPQNGSIRRRIKGAAEDGEFRYEMPSHGKPKWG